MSDVDSARQRLLEAYSHATVVMVRSDEPDLTDRQKSVLLKVYLDEEAQTVRGLAIYANISKPAVTRALDRLTEFDLVRRKTDPNDRRSVLVQRTIRGRTFLRRLSDVLLEAQQVKPKPKAA